MNSPVRLAVSPTAASSPTVVFSQRFEALFPRWNSGLCGLPHSPVVPPGLSALECGTALSAISRLTESSSHCPSPPLLMDECFFFNSLVVGLPYSLIFCQFWLVFVFKLVVVLLLVAQGGTVSLPMPPS